jgi:ectoine hydroxylase-related dioxygenase (phytanoyl-CoA dioxygenase family)
MWAVSDFAAESGATQQVPGSHRWPAGREPHDDEIVTAEMPRGSVLLWLGSTLHGAGASVAGAATRHGMLLGYVSINTLPAQLLFKRRLRLHRRAPPPPHALPQARTSVSFGWPLSRRRYCLSWLRPEMNMQVRKRHFLRHLYIKCIILPRQARDEHRENSKKVPFSLSGPAHPTWLRAWTAGLPPS